VTPDLFRKYTTVKAFAESDIEELKENIRPAGFYNHKAKSIKESMKTIIKIFNGKVPDKMEDLLQLEGVGRKTANVVLGDAFGIPGVVVDTHVKRLSSRMELTKNTDPEKIEQDLMKLLPPNQWTLLGHLMIDHGRAICIARKPKCPDCFLNDICPSAEIPAR
jgi:endonuclease-3